VDVSGRKDAHSAVRRNAQEVVGMDPETQRDVAPLNAELIAMLLAVPGVLVFAGLWHMNRPRHAPDVTQNSGGRVFAGTSQQPAHTGAQPGEESDCPICLNACQWPCETTCGHRFCSACVTTYWRSSGALAALSCPMCRTRVTLLIPCFAAEGGDGETRQARLRDLAEYNSVHGLANARSVREALRSVGPLLRGLGRHLAQQPLHVVIAGLHLRQLFVIISAFLYLISPVDFVPEVSCCPRVSVCEREFRESSTQPLAKSHTCELAARRWFSASSGLSTTPWFSRSYSSPWLGFTGSL